MLTVNRSILASRIGKFRSLFVNSAVLSKKQFTPPSPAERLKSLRSAERSVAIFAGISLLLGYFALKKTLGDMASKRQDHPPPRPLVIAGPSGSGKSTLLRKLLEEYPEDFGFSVSHTSRKPRPGEKHGKEYYFSTKEEMKRRIDNGEFIEWAEYSANIYGTSKKAVADVQIQGRVCILDIDMQGVRSIKETDLSPMYVFIKPPSIKELEERLRKRKTETEESLQRRLQAAKEEMEYAEKPGVFDYLVVNDTVENAYERLKSVVAKEVEVSQNGKK